MESTPRYTAVQSRHGWRVMDGECLVYEFAGTACGYMAQDYVNWCNRQADAIKSL